MLRFARRLAGALVTLFVVALALLMLAPGLLGYERYVITTGSMSGTYDPGTLIYDEVVPVEDLRVGDVITYAPPAGKAPTALVTHRIVAIAKDRDGRPVYRTKGDANQSADPWRFQLDEPTQARVRHGIPHVGRVVLALADPGTRRLVIGIPALLVALFALSGTVAEARRRSGPGRAGAGRATPAGAA